jgi:hypothetical protein
LGGLVTLYHLVKLEPHPSRLRRATFPDREGYNKVEEFIIIIINV